jgi:beta-mannosidase
MNPYSPQAWLISVSALVFFLASGSAPASPAAAADVVTLSSGWQLQDIAQAADKGELISTTAYTPANWFKATVPGTVLTSLVNDGVYPEPLYGENNRPDKIPDKLCRTSYWYRTQVNVPPSFVGRQVWLNFDGINYTAEVWINGHDLGAIRGAFVRGIFNVTPFVRPSETAVVAVLIQPPPHPANPEEQTVAAGTGLNGGILSQDGPTFICTQGWDWIPGIRDRDMGIWQKVTLTASGPVVVENPLVTSHLPLPRTDTADLTVEATVHNVTDAPQSGTLQGSFEGGVFSAPVTLQPGESKLVKFTAADTPPLHLANPRLWWPNGYGKPELYSLHLSFTTGAKSEDISDARDLNFGVREITYALPGSDNLALSVNGVPVMCKGGDWGMDEAMKRIPRERLEAQIRYHQLANVNMIRNWVGQSTSEDFYDLCDHYGIMLWDEFFEPNPSDSGRDAVGVQDDSLDVRDIPMYLANVREKVLRYRNHPSIALWCGRNEGDPGPAAVANGVKKIMAELEPVRLYHPNSNDGAGVRSGGPYSWRVPENYYVFPTGANPEAFKTELGSVSIPTLEAVKAMMPEKDWNTINDDWAEHDLCYGAQSARGRQYQDLLARRYGVSANLAEFVRKSQLACYESYRALYEGRFARLFHPSTGVLTWMSNPSQPSFVWQYYSYDLEPLASLYGTQKACEPVHVMMNQATFHLMVINNTPAPLAGLTARVRVFNLDGSLKSDQTTPITAPASAATDVGAIDFPADLSLVHFVKLELKDADGKLVSDNFYWRALPANAADYTALDKIASAQLAATIKRHDAGGKLLLDVTLSNPTKVIAVMAHLQLRRSDTRARVLPVYYTQNFVSLLPGESRTITIEADAKNFADTQPLVMLDGWNVTVKNQSFHGGASIELNADAQPGGEPRGAIGNPAAVGATRSPHGGTASAVSIGTRRI